MATIFGISSLTFAYPEEHISEQNVSMGRAADGSYKESELRAPDRIIPITLQLITQTQMLNVKNALEAATKRQGTITPDANIDLGAGAGVGITAKWIDKRFQATRSSPFWTVTLNFVKV